MVAWSHLTQLLKRWGNPWLQPSAYTLTGTGNSLPYQRARPLIEFQLQEQSYTAWGSAPQCRSASWGHREQTYFSRPQESFQSFEGVSQVPCVLFSSSFNIFLWDWKGWHMETPASCCDLLVIWPLHSNGHLGRRLETGGWEPNGGIGSPNQQTPRL